jgi:hypothetical protein
MVHLRDELNRINPRFKFGLFITLVRQQLGRSSQI